MQQIVARANRSRLNWAIFRPQSLVLQHLAVIFLFFLIGIGVTWPLVADFSGKLIGVGTSDIKHSVWILWNFLQSVQFRSSPFNTTLLYYPKGISLLLDGAGPLSGLISLPFWPFGPAAAYNGTILVGVTFSGYFMYLFARSLGFSIGPSIFAGIVLQLGPAHLAGVYGHLEKTFVGLLPLILLALHKALDPQKKWWWCVATAVGMLLIGLYSGYQFIMAGIGVGFFFIVLLLGAAKPDRFKVLKRAALIIISSVIIVGPLIIGILIESKNPDTSSNVAVNVTAPYYEPDLTQFILPPYYNALWAPLVYNYFPGSYAPTKAKFPGLEISSTWNGIGIETSVTLSLTALVLSFFAIRYQFKTAWRWLFFTLFCIILSLGPTLRILGNTSFTAFKLPIILPFAFVDSLPGLEFLRASGRIMMLGAVGLGISAAYGLKWLGQKWPDKKSWITVGCVALLLLESWPRPWPTALLPTVPTFYQQLAADHDNYGVLDLPFAWGTTTSGGGWPDYASTYQMYQMAHHKSIAWGYLSHTYNVDKYPISFINQIIREQKVDNSFLEINGSPTNLYNQKQLVENNFRYVVYHKTLYHSNPKAPEHLLAQQYLAAVFGADAKPFYEDNMVQVYKVTATPAGSANGTSVQFELGQNWRAGEQDHRWATTPATLEIDSTVDQEATLEISPVALYDPKVKGLGTNGVLLINSDSTPVTSVPITINKLASISIKLHKGNNVITLALQAGNFQPSQYGGNDNSILSFAVNKINLVVKN